MKRSYKYQPTLLASDHSAYIIGVMSGSSLDGLDLAYVKFGFSDSNYTYQILFSACVPLPLILEENLKKATSLSGLDLNKLDIELGKYIGEEILQFTIKNKIENPVDLISSHGHTIFHYPTLKTTVQIGNGTIISNLTNTPTLTNLRMVDVANGGQGAPIVPIGDLLLFGEYKYCLNLGGICNISVKTSEGIKAYDIGAFNQVFNYLAHHLSLQYDDKGKLASTGQIHTALLNEMNALSFYQMTSPKSLDNSFSVSEIFPLLEKYKISIEDKMHTFCEHIATEIARQISLWGETNEDQILVTGGGAYNDFFIEKLQTKTTVKVIVPSTEIIEYKEALVMAFMGYLYTRGEVNVLSTVTGAASDTINGILHL